MSLRRVFPILLICFFALMYIFNQEKFHIIKSGVRPIFISFILAYVLDAVVRFLVKLLKIKRFQGIFLACIILLSFFASIFAVLVPMIVDNAESFLSIFSSDSIMDEENNYIDVNILVMSIAERLDNEIVDNIAESIIKLSADLKGKISQVIKGFVDFLLKLLTTIGTSLISIVTCVVLALYMLIEKEEIVARLKRFIYAFFSEKEAKRFMEICSNANRIFTKFLVGKVVDSMLVGIICILGFALFDIPYAPLLGSLIGLFNLIPYFGPIIGAVPVVIVAFITEPAKTIIVIVIIIVVGQIDANFLDPKIVGENVGVTPFWVISAVLIGGTIFGVIGMILSVPLMVLIKTMIEEEVEIRLGKKGMENYQIENLKNNK